MKTLLGNYHASRDSRNRYQIHKAGWNSGYWSTYCWNSLSEKIGKAIPHGNIERGVDAVIMNGTAWGLYGRWRNLRWCVLRKKLVDHHPINNYSEILTINSLPVYLRWHYCIHWCYLGTFTVLLTILQWVLNYSYILFWILVPKVKVLPTN
jgi:hypothetical protein